MALCAFSFTLAVGQPAATPAASNESHPPELVTRTLPVYPPIAKAAHVSGQVKLQIEIGVDGHVTGEKVISGPPMLVGAAEACVKQWVYDTGGRTYSTVVTVDFGLPPPINPNDQEIASRFFPADQACIKGVSTNIDPAQQADACRRAADIALQFSKEERFIERRSAFVYASTALRRNREYKDALGYANLAVAVVDQGHDDGSGSSAAYGVRAQAEAGLGDLSSASDDLTKAEAFERDAIVKMRESGESEFVQHEYVPTLKGLLNFHAQVLSAMGDVEQAEAKSAEAARL